MVDNAGQSFIKVPVSMISRLRNFLHDYAKVNEIIGEERFTDEFLANMIIDSVIEYNSIEPAGVPGWGGYPALSFDLSFEKLTELKPIYRRWVQDLAVIRALTSISIPMQFNEIMVSSGNIQENVNAQWRNISITIQSLENKTRASIKEHKEKLNAVACDGFSLTEFYYPYMGSSQTFNVPY